MTRTELRNSRAQRTRRKRARRIRRMRSIMIVILVISAVLCGTRLAKNMRYSGINAEDGVPLLLQTDERWKDTPYGNSTIEISGCGPTCLSMVLVALTGNQDMTPASVAEFSQTNGYYVDGIGTSWSLMSDGAKKLGLKVKELPLDEKTIADRLNNGYPVICSVTRGDFTDEGHFIVLTSYENGSFRVNDPNSSVNSARAWSYDRLKGQISAMWTYRG